MSNMRTTVIVGAGSGGSALAYRLTEEPDEQVVLVEAGPDYAELPQTPQDICNAAQMSVQDHDWGLQAYFLEPPDKREPQPYPRGRVVGGSSSVNAAIAQRATVEDLDTWVAAGCPEWSYDATLPYFQRLENDLDVPDGPGHGNSGPIPITRHWPDEWAPAVRYFAQACLDRGYPECKDFNAKGSTGVGAVPRNLIGEEELRASALLTYVAEARRRPNFRLLADTACRRVVFDGNRAIGVEVERDGQVEQIAADRVVLAAGAVHTPHILTLSGVGPAEVLDAIDVDRVAVSEGVGRNFQDHPFTPVVALLKDPTDKEGVRAQLKFSSSDGGLVDDVMLFATVLEPATLNLDIDTKGRKALILNSLLAKPRSIGWLTTVSPDHRVQPELHVNFLSDRSDVERLKESVRLAYDILTRSQVADEVSEVLFPDADTVADDKKLTDYIYAVSQTSYHASATCRMGSDGDPHAVVDQRLAVRGTEGLWVADASVMVNVTTGLTNLTAYMVGERLADYLKADGPDARGASGADIAAAPV
jgi:choline dehydrogenase